MDASQYTGDLKSVYDVAYALTLEIYSSAANTYYTNCAVTSSASSSRRTANVGYSASAGNDQAAGAAAAARQLALDPSGLNNNINNANQLLGKSVQQYSASGATQPEINSTPPGSPTSSNNNSDGLSGGAIAGIVIGCVVGFVLIVAAVYFLIIKGSGSGAGSKADDGVSMQPSDVTVRVQGSGSGAGSKADDGVPMQPSDVTVRV